MSLIARDQTMASSPFVFKNLIAVSFSDNVLGPSDSHFFCVLVGKWQGWITWGRGRERLTTKSSLHVDPAVSHRIYYFTFALDVIFPLLQPKMLGFPYSTQQDWPPLTCLCVCMPVQIPSVSFLSCKVLVVRGKKPREASPVCSATALWL